MTMVIVNLRIKSFGKNPPAFRTLFNNKVSVELFNYGTLCVFVSTVHNLPLLLSQTIGPTVAEE